MATDEQTIRALLKQALEQEVPGLASRGFGAEEQANLAKLCEEAADVVCRLQASAKEGDQPAGLGAGPDDDMDAHTLELYRQVCAADERVRRLRREVPGELTDCMQRQLASCRPASQQPAAAAEAPSTHAEGEPETASQVPETGADADADTHVELLRPELESAWKQLNDVTNNVPALMAKLDHTLQRLTRVVAITESDHNRPSPRTVEKALFGRTLVAQQGEEGTGADKMEKDLGAENTRQRLAYDLGA